MRFHSLWFVLFLWGIFSLFPLAPSSCNFAAEVKSLSIGDRAPDFDLPGVDDKNHRLEDFSDAKVLVVIFTCNHCPTAQAYEDRIIKLYHDFRARQVAIVAISPNDAQAVRLDELGYTDLSDSLEDMKLRAEEKKFPFPYLYDGERQQVSRAYGVLATPHIFIFDQKRKLRFVGAVDDNHQGMPKSNYARNAMEDLLADRPVAREKTRVFGCSTKWSDKRDSARKSIEKWNAEPVTLEKIDVDGVRKLAQNNSDKYRLINVWATWCAPCVNEMPELVTINRMYRKRPFELITISMDSVEEMDRTLATLKRKRMAMTNYIFDASDRDALADALDKDWEGPVPYTLFIAPGGKVIYRQLNEIEPLKLKRAIVEQLGRTYK